MGLSQWLFVSDWPKRALSPEQCPYKGNRRWSSSAGKGAWVWYLADPDEPRRSLFVRGSVYGGFTMASSGLH